MPLSALLLSRCHVHVRVSSTMIGPHAPRNVHNRATRPHRWTSGGEGERVCSLSHPGGRPPAIVVEGITASSHTAACGICRSRPAVVHVVPLTLQVSSNRVLGCLFVNAGKTGEMGSMSNTKVNTTTNRFRGLQQSLGHATAFSSSSRQRCRQRC